MRHMRRGIDVLTSDGFSSTSSPSPFTAYPRVVRVFDFAVAAFFAAAILLAVSGCTHMGHQPTCGVWHEYEGGHEVSRFRPGEPLQRQGDEIVAAGQLFHTG